MTLSSRVENDDATHLRQAAGSEVVTESAARSSCAGKSPSSAGGREIAERVDPAAPGGVEVGTGLGR